MTLMNRLKENTEVSTSLNIHELRAYRLDSMRNAHAKLFIFVQGAVFGELSEGKKRIFILM